MRGEDDVGSAVEEWRDYFLFTGTIGATLLGLLFVAVSLNVATILSDDNRHLKELAGQTYQNFILVVIASLLFLFPGLTSSRFLSFGFLGVYGLGWLGYRLYIGVRAADPDFHWTRILRRLLPAAIACLCMVYAAFPASEPAAQPLVALGLASALLLISATASSWDLLLRVARSRRIP
jgi:hypothetical protein